MTIKTTIQSMAIVIVIVMTKMQISTKVSLQKLRIWHLRIHRWIVIAKSLIH